MKSNSSINYNNISFVESQQQDCNSPDFFAELQESHKRNKKQLHKMALNTEQIEKAQRIISCTNFLTYELINEEFLRLKRINLCRERLCLNCQLVNSRSLIKQLFWSIPRLNVASDENLQFITLTAENCKAKELKKTIQHMTKRQVAFFRHYGIKDYFRSVEVTYNAESNTFHPHLHLVSLVSKKSNFPVYEPKKGIYGANRLQKEWSDWLALPSAYQYKQATAYEIKTTRSIFEVCKYVSKVKDLENISVLKVLDEQLKGLRLKTPLGQFKNLAKRYKAECATIKLQELKALEEAEVQLIDLLYNPTRKEYEIKSIREKKLEYRPMGEFWHERRKAESKEIFSNAQGSY